MANHKSALKRNRQNLKQRARNKGHLSLMRSTLKKFNLLLEGKKGAAAKKAFPAMVKNIDELATKGIIHKKNASRKISRLNLALNKISK